MNIEKKQRWVDGAKVILENFKATQSKQALRLRSFFQWDPG